MELGKVSLQSPRHHRPQQGKFEDSPGPRDLTHSLYRVSVNGHWAWGRVVIEQVCTLHTIVAGKEHCHIHCAPASTMLQKGCSDFTSLRGSTDTATRN